MNLVSFDGHAINDKTHYEALIPEDAPVMAQTRALYTERLEAFPVFSSKKLSETRFPVVIAIRSGGSLGELKAWFDPAQLEPMKLVAQYDSKNWYLMVTPEVVEAYGSGGVQVTLACADPVWTLDAEVSDTWAVIASENEIELTVGGNRYTEPRFEIAASAGGGYAYKRFVTVRNPTTLAMVNIPLELTGGWDTASLVSGGKMQTDGDDLRLLMDGNEAPRWLADMNTSATKVWCALDLKPGQSLTLEVAVPASGGVGELTFKKISKAALKLLPPAGILLIDSELFTYSSVNLTTRKVGGVTRAAKGTSEAAHSIGATVYWIEHDIWIIYGNASAEAPEVDDTRKPVIELDVSSNTSWVYALFGDATGLRSGGWNGTVLKSNGKLSRLELHPIKWTHS